MISARGPDPRRQTSLASMSGHLCFASLARLPDRSTKCRPAAAGASNRAVGPASNPFPSGLLPSGIGRAKPTIQQARDRAEWLAISVRATPLTLTARRSDRRQQSVAQRVARDRNVAFIVPLIFKCLETLESGFPISCDTGDSFSRSRR